MKLDQKINGNTAYHLREYANTEEILDGNKMNFTINADLFLYFKK